MSYFPWNFFNDVYDTRPFSENFYLQFKIRAECYNTKTRYRNAFTYCSYAQHSNYGRFDKVDWIFEILGDMQ